MRWSYTSYAVELSCVASDDRRWSWMCDADSGRLNMQLLAPVLHNPPWPQRVERLRHRNKYSNPSITSSEGLRHLRLAMDFNTLRDQVSNLTLYDIKAGVRKVQNGKPGPSRAVRERLR